MLDALCQLDSDTSKVYSIFDFQRLDDQQIERLRQNLSCIECGGKAYYRKASLDGKSACFGSRYHKSDCKAFHPSKEKERELRHANEVKQVMLESDALMIDFNAPVPKQEKAKVDPKRAVGAKATATKREVVKQEAKPNEIDTKLVSQGLEKLLHSLLRGSELDKSDLWVYTGEKYRWRAKNLFVNFAEAEPVENGAPRMYWGTISHTDKEMEWLNPADCKDVGIPIAEVKQSLFARFGIHERRDLEGAGIILFGQCFWNKDKTRKIIKLWGKDGKRCFITKALDD